MNDTIRAPGLVVDLFAGGGGASVGLTNTFGRVDIAINHDPRAIRMHEENHPYCKHHHCDVWEVDPREAVGGLPIAVLWASPDCTYFSKARNGKPFRDRHFTQRRRALATVVTRWAKATQPEVIMLENVEEFAKWGPLDDDGLPDKTKRGQSFRRWVSSLAGLGYNVEWRNLKACDYGAPTSRKRLFIVARKDGAPIHWPEPTHGPELIPYRTAAEIIDWSLPTKSIFDRAKPLAEATLRRIARGVIEKVIMDPRPFVVDKAYTLVTRSQGERPGQTPRVPGLEKPLGTLVAGGQKHALITAHLSQFYSGGGQIGDLKEPIGTITAGGNHHAVVAAYGHMINHGGRDEDLEQPFSTLTTSRERYVVAAYLARHWGGMTGSRIDKPWPTLTTKGCQDQIVELSLQKPFDRVNEVRAFLTKYYGTGNNVSDADAPLDTLTTKARFGLVTVEGHDYQITDIGMRMLTPREMFNAQGFPQDYKIDIPVDRPHTISASEVVTGKKLGITDQTFLVGNSVCPDVAEAIARANSPLGDRA